jgi:hypothetical protein
VLPNLIIIGAAKCGTTSLHRYLDLHPEIAMAKAKELDFFIEDRNWTRGVGWYESQFRPAAIRGESSPLYSSYPAYAGVAELMAGVLPEARLVYVVRDPIERLVSSYRFDRWVAGRDQPSLEEQLGDLDQSRYVATSRYAFQLDQYLPFFSVSQIAVVDHSELRDNPPATMTSLFRFLGVDDTFTTEAFGRRHYQTEELYAANALGRAAKSLGNRALGRPTAKLLRSRAPDRLLRPLLVRPEVPAVTLDPGLRARLEDCFKEDVDRLRKLTGRRFESWSV